MKRNHKRPPFKTLSDSKELIVESLRLPKDTMLGAAIVTITGNREAFIENYKGILEYTTQTIVLQGKNCKICFEGKQLSIEYYTNEDMKISGMIDTVRYF
jgi:sporulation protein YqfC